MATTNFDTFKEDHQTLQRFLRALNQRLSTNRVAERNRALLICAVLVALRNPDFKAGYSKYTQPSQLAKRIQDEALAVLRVALSQRSRGLIEQTFGFIEHETGLLGQDEGSFLDDNELKQIVQQVDHNVGTFVAKHRKYDVLSELYVEFLRYSNKDKGLGVVLTPPHITELIAALAQVNKHSVVYDNCVGTAGFLVAALKRMIDDGLGLSDTAGRLLGVEFQADIFPLAVCNLLLHSASLNGIEHGTCFDENIIADMKASKPDVGLLNPPYKLNKKHDTEEWEFVFNNLDTLSPGAVCVAVLPMQTVLSTSDKTVKLKSRLMKRHTLEGVISLPDQVFFNSRASAVTCVVIITAHQPHPADKQVWLGLGKDDGYTIEKHKGRIDPDSRWPAIRDTWINTFLSRTETPHFSVTRPLRPEEDWCAEAYVTRDHSLLSRDDFQHTLRTFVGCMFAQGNLDAVHAEAANMQPVNLTDREWQHFKVGDLLNVSRSHYVERKALAEGCLPYVTRIASNNGVDGHGSHKRSYEGNCITIGPEGIVAFYQPGQFIAGTVNIVRHPNMSASVAMFLVTVMDFVHVGKHNYGYAVSKGRLEASQIPLPVNNKNQPDWEFMSRYVKQLRYSSNLEQL